MEEPAPHQCPHLGILDDPNTSHSFPSSWNACFHAKVPSVPTFEHQEAVCLTDKYVSCPVYQAAKGAPFPVNLQNTVKPPKQEQGSSKRVYAYIAGAVLLLALFGWLGSVAFNIPARVGLLFSGPSPVAPVVKMTDTALVQLTATLQMVATATPTALLTVTPTIEATAVPFKSFVLETPFKIGDTEFFIHRIKDGDGLDILSIVHHTTPAIIQEINYSLKLPILADNFLVIHPDMTSLDPAEPAFEIYEVTDKVILMDELAKKLSVDLVRLKYYNPCADRCILSRGDLVLVPRHR